MGNSEEIIDKEAVARSRARSDKEDNFLQKLAVQEIQDRLKFIKKHHMENLFMDTNLMCIGEKTSAILNEIKWKKIFLFNPGEEEFLLYKI